jgi:hypothetical protein
MPSPSIQWRKEGRMEEFKEGRKEGRQQRREEARKEGSCATFKPEIVGGRSSLPPSFPFLPPSIPGKVARKEGRRERRKEGKKEATVK